MTFVYARDYSRKELSARELMCGMVDWLTIWSNGKKHHLARPETTTNRRTHEKRLPTSGFLQQTKCNDIIFSLTRSLDMQFFLYSSIFFLLLLDSHSTAFDFFFFLCSYFFFAFYFFSILCECRARVCMRSIWANVVYVYRHVCIWIDLVYVQCVCSVCNAMHSFSARRQGRC